MEGFCVFLQVVVTSWSDIFGDKDYLDDFHKLPRIRHLTKTLFLNSSDDFLVYGTKGRFERGVTLSDCLFFCICAWGVTAQLAP